LKHCDCGCCEGTRVTTPLTLSNRPGLSALSYRVGTYGDFFNSMKARLSSLDITSGTNDGSTPSQPDPLADLSTRDVSDPSIALLDAWAVTGEILTFYTERLANEGFLRTATDPASVAMLAKLTGTAPGTGVAASTLLAYSLQTGAANITIPAGTRAQNVPAQNQLAQTFETSDDLDARVERNNMQPRQTRPEAINIKTIASNEPVISPGHFHAVKTQ
jgi:hypothetical protein